jgi:hypothetical protein
MMTFAIVAMIIAFILGAIATFKLEAKSNK